MASPPKADAGARNSFSSPACVALSLVLWTPTPLSPEARTAHRRGALSRRRAVPNWRRSLSFKDWNLSRVIFSAHSAVTAWTLALRGSLWRSACSPK